MKMQETKQLGGGGREGRVDVNQVKIKKKKVEGGGGVMADVNQELKSNCESAEKKSGGGGGGGSGWM